jgi:hypothetical protein
LDVLEAAANDFAEAIRTRALGQYTIEEEADFVAVTYRILAKLGRAPQGAFDFYPGSSARAPGRAVTSAIVPRRRGQRFIKAASA